MICEICGRPDVTSDSRTWDQARHYADSLCWRRSLTNRPGKDADCYRIGYEREKARAGRAENRIAALELPWQCDHCGLTNGHLVGCRYGAPP